jgi:hypothetical protein
MNLFLLSIISLSFTLYIGLEFLNNGLNILGGL